MGEKDTFGREAASLRWPSVEDFRSYTRAMLQRGASNRELDEVDDYLQSLCLTDPSRARDFAHVSAECLAASGRPESHAYALNTLLQAHLRCGDGDEALQVFLRGMAICTGARLEMPGKSLIATYFFGVHSGTFGDELALTGLREARRFHVELKQFDSAIDALLEAADYFASVHAMQASYRALHDAEQIAVNEGLPLAHARVLAVLGESASNEPDFAFAEKCFNQCVQILQEQRAPVPAHVLINQGTVLLKQGRIPDAITRLEGALKCSQPKDGHLRAAAILNLAVCYRHVDRVPEAADLVASLRTSPREEWPLGLELEFELVDARLHTSQARPSESEPCVRRALALIDKQLLPLLRLHYRRGVRGMWVTRLLPILHELPASGSSSWVLPAFAAIHTSVISDWCGILDWYKVVVEDERLTAQIKERLQASMLALRTFGTPVLYGFREKYDDPFESAENSPDMPEHIQSRFSIADYSLPWREFGIAATSAARLTSHPMPTSRITLERSAALIQSLAEPSRALLFLSHGSESHAWLVIGSTYRRMAIDRQAMSEYYGLLVGRRMGETPRQDFVDALIRVTTSLSRAFGPTLDLLADSDVKDITIIPDRWAEVTPLTPVLVSHERIRAKMRAGELSIRQCPILHPEEKRERTPLRTIAGLVDSRVPLPLAASEVRCAAGKLDAELAMFDLAQTTLDYLSSCVQRDIVHIATHGTPICMFTDPQFASLVRHGRQSEIYLTDLQQVTPDGLYQLCVVNACHGAAVTSRNFQQDFVTNELIGYPSLLLMNRKSTIVAPSWAAFDLVAYIFTERFYSHIAHCTVAMAFAKSLVDLYEMDREGIVDVLRTIDDAELREQKIAQIVQAKDPYPLRNPYCYGVYTLSTLV